VSPMNYVATDNKTKKQSVSATTTKYSVILDCITVVSDLVMQT
jgi:hypothetical protein